MGSYTFKWENPAEDVHVTGTFDNWTKSIQLEKQDGVFKKTVDLPAGSQKIYYKYVVDNNWTVKSSDPKEADHEGNINNFLVPSDLTPFAAAAASPETAVISNVGPNATTAALAGAVPLEKDAAATPSDIPGGFPETPANELDKPIGINPLPAADGAINPVPLAPGEKLPDNVKTASITDHVKLDKESYEKSDTLAGVDMSIPPASETKIPEIGFAAATDDKSKDASAPVISTVGAGATTAALAGAVTKEPKQASVPEVVKDSQEKADAPPEASAEPQEVADKVKVEDELKQKVPEAPATSEGTSGFGTEKTENTGIIAGAAAAAVGAITAGALAAKDLIQERAGPVVQQATEAANSNLPDSVKEKLPVSAQEALAGQSKEEKREEVSPEVPAEVKQSITEANKEPEAAANTAAVENKAAVEAELQKEVKPVPADGETKGEDVKQEGTTERAAANGSTAANGNESKPAGAVATPAERSEESADKKKKKNRLSAIFSKIKHKLSD